MTEVILQPPKGFPVTVGGITLYLSSYKIVGVCVLKEQCTADNLAGVTASYPKGTRLTMQGKLAPSENSSAVTAVLAQRLADGSLEDVNVQGLVFTQARLCGYTITEGQSAPEVILQFYTAKTPTLAEDGNV